MNSQFSQVQMVKTHEVFRSANSNYPETDKWRHMLRTGQRIPDTLLGEPNQPGPCGTQQREALKGQTGI